MKKLFLIISALAMVASCQSVKSESTTHRVMSANIRITGLEPDAGTVNEWDNRKEYMIEVLRAYNPDIIMMQEVIYDSYAYCKEQLNDYFAFGFEGPEMDPFTEGYHFIGKNVIFFSKERYELVSAGCYWLSEDPVIGGSISWDTNRARHANWVRVLDRKSGKQLRLIDIHLDHKSNDAKVNQAKLIVREAAQYQEDFPQILCGDFNSGKTTEQVVRRHKAVDAVLNRSRLQENRNYAKVHGHAAKLEGEDPPIVLIGAFRVGHIKIVEKLFVYFR